MLCGKSIALKIFWRKKMMKKNRKRANDRHYQKQHLNQHIVFYHRWCWFEISFSIFLRPNPSLAQGFGCNKLKTRNFAPRKLMVEYDVWFAGI
jgi:hypothetical protein